MWKQISNYFENIIIKVDTADGVVTKTPTRGCPQRSVLGPIFWDLVIQPCLEKQHNMQQVERVVAYTDDLAVVLKVKSRK